MEVGGARIKKDTCRVMRPFDGLRGTEKDGGMNPAPTPAAQALK